MEKFAEVFRSHRSDESAVGVFQSYAVQQVVAGTGRSAKEVSHCNMGLHTVWVSCELAMSFQSWQRNALPRFERDSPRTMMILHLVVAYVNKTCICEGRSGH